MHAEQAYRIEYTEPPVGITDQYCKIPQDHA